MTDLTQEDVDNLPPTQWLMVAVLAARYRLGEALWTFPSGPAYRKAADHLAKLGIVVWKSGVAAKTIQVWFTAAGKKLMDSHPYTPPILQREETPRQPLDLRAVAVILARGQDAARDMGDPGLAQSLWFMTEQTIALYEGPSHIIGNLDEEFAQVKANYQ